MGQSKIDGLAEPRKMTVVVSYRPKLCAFCGVEGIPQIETIRPLPYDNEFYIDKGIIPKGWGVVELYGQSSLCLCSGCLKKGMEKDE